MTKLFDWPLATSPFTIWDRLKVAYWIATQDQYTMSTRVAQLEEEMSQLAGARAVMVVNGSVANQLVFEMWKVKHPMIDPREVTVLVPAVTWISSVTPAMSLGFKIRFVDINLTDFAFDYEALEVALKEEFARGKHAIIWPTALIGFTPDMARLQVLADQYEADLFLDSCENTLSYTEWNRSILASASLTTTSTYTSHQCCSIEGGFVFCRDEADWALARMLRNHGLTRSLTGDWETARKVIEDANPTIDPSFLFVVPGTNLRPSDVHAMFGLQDIKRVDQYRIQRQTLYQRFHEGLDHGRYYLPPLNETHVGFCLPVFCWPRASDKRTRVNDIKRALNEAGIQTRPIIGSNLLHQPPFKAYGKPEDYPNAQWVHERGFYVGMHSGVTEQMVDDLTDLLNSL